MTKCNGYIYDHIIIGGGISGSYIANRLSKIFTNESILLIEKTNNLCGRLKSLHYDNINKNNIGYEFGGMRIYPDIHPLFNNLLNELKIDKLKINETEENNIAFILNNTFKMKSYINDTKYLYNLGETENIKDIYNVINKYLTKYDYLTYDNRFKIYNDLSLTEFDFKTLIKKNISNDLLRQYMHINGYDEWINKNINFITVAMNIVQFKDSYDHYFIKNGTYNICNKLILKFNNIDFLSLSNNQFVENQCSDRLNYILNVNVDKIKKINNNLFSIKIENIGNIEDTEEMIFNKVNNLIIYGKKIYITTPKNSLKYMYDWDNQFIKILENLFEPLKAMKIALQFEKNFWNEFGIYNGKTVTTTQEKQIWYYDEKTLLIYSLYNGYDELYSYFPHKSNINWLQFPTEYDSINYAVDQIIHKNLQLLFKNYTVNIPKPNKIAWQIWNEGANFWKPIKFKYYNVSSFDELKNKIYFPSGLNNSLYIINNDFSINQGWVEGCLEDSNQLLKKLYNYHNN